MAYKLDWKPRFDERSRNYRIQSEESTGELIKWEPPEEVLDQGSEGACVGFGWSHAINGDPFNFNLPDKTTTAHGIYKLAQYIDYWEGEDYEGTSVLAGAQVCKKLGLISEYRWCFNIDEVITALKTIGPVVIGIPWYSGMYQTEDSGFVKVDGQLVGGHCLLLYGYQSMVNWEESTPAASQIFYWRNSWGPSYGNNGTGIVSYTNLQRLLSDNAEACVPIKY